MSVEIHRESPGKFNSRTLNRKTLSRWTGRNHIVISALAHAKKLGSNDKNINFEHGVGTLTGRRHKRGS